MTHTNIQSYFKETGIYSLDRKNLTKDDINEFSTATDVVSQDFAPLALNAIIQLDTSNRFQH